MIPLEDSTMSQNFLCDNNSKKLRSADEILKDIGWRNVYILRITLIGSLSWAFAAMSMMCSAFYIVINEGSTANTSSVELAITSLSSNTSVYTVEDLTKIADHSTSLFMFGSMIGATVLTYASDRIGRKPIIIISMIGLTLTGFIPMIGQRITVLPIGRFLQGFNAPGLLLVGWVLAYESIPVQFRAYASLTFGIQWVVGYCTVALIAYYTTNWTLITVGCTAPSVIGAILFTIFLPESLHFLVIKDKRAEVQKWINKARRYTTEKTILHTEEIMYQQRLNTADSQLQTAEISTKLKSSLLDELKKTKIFFIFLLILIYLWTTDTFLYYGLSLYTTKLAGNIYWNYTLSGLIELPVYVLTPIFLERFGRKPIVVTAHLVAGAVLAAFIFHPDKLLGTVFWIIGKFAISCAFICIFVYSSEIFPTTIRSGCVGICTVIARIGGIMAPYAGYLVVIASFFPMLFFGILSTISAVLTIFLPETRNQALPSSLNELIG